MSEKMVTCIEKNIKNSISVIARDYPANYTVPFHTHSSRQIIYAVSGVMQIMTDCGMWLVPPQRALWMPGKTAHSMHTRGNPVALRTVYIDTAFCLSGAPDEPCVIQISGLLRELILAASAAVESYRKREYYILGLITEEITWSKESGLHLPAGKDRRLAIICKAILSNPHDNRTLDEWAKRTGTSTRTLSRLFISELGVSFQIWRQQARVLAALPRLASGESVTTIAMETGYETPGAFSAMFKRLLGVTPSRYFTNVKDS
ncbi:MAG: helix-turn-helix transcriptional regulator [Klebsiella pneumoniae]|nr:helix-turn-helix transcriptional regulator [Klebsiella pneumoniae]